MKLLGENDVLTRLMKGAFVAFLQRINGQYGENWLRAFNRFLRGEHPWLGTLSTSEVWWQAKGVPFYPKRGDLRCALEKAKIEIPGVLEYMLRDDNNTWLTSDRWTDESIILTTPAHLIPLGNLIPSRVTLEYILSRAELRQFNLSTVPWDLGPAMAPVLKKFAFHLGPCTLHFISGNGRGFDVHIQDKDVSLLHFEFDKNREYPPDALLVFSKHVSSKPNDMLDFDFSSKYPED